VALVVDPDGVELPTIRELVDLRGLRILEVGCGEGRMTFGCAQEAASVLAFDAEEELVRTARRSTPRALRDRIRFEVADAAEIDLPPAEFDLALFSWSL
jgi:ubiquinone/menaquinone biosynthesis C-methylase UbiE